MVGINDEAVVAAVAACFERYERALLDNDLDTLAELFWDDARTVRFGPEGSQFGSAAVDAHRRSLARQTLPRQLRNVRLTTFGPDCATVWTEFVPDGHPNVGRQSQTWIRFDEGWRVVAAHVSWEHGAAPTGAG